MGCPSLTCKGHGPFHSLTGNVANANGGYGIFAYFLGLGVVDGGKNRAHANAAPTQCIGVVCKRSDARDGPSVSPRQPSCKRPNSRAAHSGQYSEAEAARPFRDRRLGTPSIRERRCC